VPTGRHRRVRALRTTLIGGLAVLLLAACSDDDATVATGASTPDSTEPAVAPDIEGTITAVTPFEPVTEGCTPAADLDPDGAASSDDPPVCTPDDHDVLGTILVEERPGTQEGRKVSFTVTSATALSDDFAALAVGQAVAAWTTGPCAESYPEQCEASTIRTQDL
jgi:hypothetical protein